eukprot:8523143-Pyramimonas_sp.AAC.1
MAAYELMFPGELCDANQEPQSRALKSKDGVAGPVIRSNGLICSQRMGRWLTTVELQQLFGFPMDAEQAVLAGAIGPFTQGVGMG